MIGFILAESAVLKLEMDWLSFQQKDLCRLIWRVDLRSAGPNLSRIFIFFFFFVIPIKLGNCAGWMDQPELRWCAHCRNKHSVPIRYHRSLASPGVSVDPYWRTQFPFLMKGILGWRMPRRVFSPRSASARYLLRARRTAMICMRPMRRQTPPRSQRPDRSSPSMWPCGWLKVE